MAKNTTNTMRIQFITKEQLKKALKHNKTFEQLLQHNKGFIEKIVLKYVRRNNNDFESLYWVGASALHKAIKKFDPKREDASKFSTFAYKVIQNDVLKEVESMNGVNKKETSIEMFKNNHNHEHSEYSESHWHTRHVVNVEEQAINKVAREQYMQNFTDIERKILDLKAEGYTMPEISQKLNKNFHTLKAVFAKTVHNENYKRQFNEIF